MYICVYIYTYIHTEYSYFTKMRFLFCFISYTCIFILKGFTVIRSLRDVRRNLFVWQVRHSQFLSFIFLISQNSFVFKFVLFLCTKELQVVHLSPFVLLFLLKHTEQIGFLGEVWLFWISFPVFRV